MAMSHIKATDIYLVSVFYSLTGLSIVSIRNGCFLVSHENQIARAFEKALAVSIMFWTLNRSSLPIFSFFC